MDKKERYIEYVVEDLVSKTEIDYDQEKIKYPYPLLSSFPSSFFLPSFLTFSFRNYLKERYGAHSEEIEFIWDQYKERIKDKLNNG